MILFVTSVCTALLAAAGMVVLGRRGPRADRLATRLQRRADLGRVGAAGLAAVAVLAVTRWPAAALAVAGLIALWPRVFGGAAAGRRNLARLEALAIWTESLRDTTSSAAGLEQSIPATVLGAPALLRRPLVNLTARLDGRVPLPEALTLFADELDDPAADLVVAALCLNARQRSGGLARILTSLAATTRQELEMQRAVEHDRDSLRRQAQRIAVAVVGFAALQAVFARGWVAPYGTLVGQLTLTLLIAVFLLAFIRMRTLAEPPAEPRFLAPADRVTVAASYPVHRAQP